MRGGVAVGVFFLLVVFYCFRGGVCCLAGGSLGTRMGRALTVWDGSVLWTRWGKDT